MLRPGRQFEANQIPSPVASVFSLPGSGEPDVQETWIKVLEKAALGLVVSGASPSVPKS